jgi:hypothetical protein
MVKNRKVLKRMGNDNSMDKRYYEGVLKDGAVKLDYGIASIVPASDGFTCMEGRKFAIRSIEVFPHTLGEIDLFTKYGELKQDRYLSKPEETGIIGHTGEFYLAIPDNLQRYIGVKENSKLAILVTLQGSLSLLKEKEFYWFKKLMPSTFLEYVGNAFGL